MTGPAGLELPDKLPSSPHLNLSWSCIWAVRRSHEDRGKELRTHASHFFFGWGGG